MSRRVGLSILVVLALVVLQAGLAWGETPQEKWLKDAKLGPYAPAAEDWKAIEEAAKKEGKVVIYSMSSRVFQLKTLFEKAYPGIELVPYDIPTNTQIEKVKREQAAKVYNADVCLLTGGSLIVHELVKPRLLWNYIPPEVRDVLPPQYREPIMGHHISTKVVIYNSERYSKAPVSSLWDLTKPEWKGKVIFKDPFRDTGNMEWLMTVIQHSEEMAAEYKRVFGKDITLTTENAGREFIKMLVKNGLVLMSSDGDIAKAVGTRGQKDPPIGICDYGKMRDVIDGKLVFNVAFDVKPVVGVLQPAFVGIVNQAPHPNAAKLLIKFMMGDKEGGLGLQPWHVPGNYSVRTDVVTPAGAKPLSELNCWMPDFEYVYYHTAEFFDFWLSLL